MVSTTRSAPEHSRIAELAYHYWELRGCPEGSSEQDWLRAEQDLLTQAEAAATSEIRARKARAAGA